MFCYGAAVVHGQESPEGRAGLRQEEVIVTGSSLAGRVDEISFLTLLSREELAQRAWPRPADLARGLVLTGGLDGESNQFSSNGLAGVANIGLRGFGPGRTLVLQDGRRLVSSPFPIGDQAQAFVDINHTPFPALERIEILEEGAGSIYGSDAVAGVVNLVTRSGHTGWERRAVRTLTQGGDLRLAALGGWRNDDSSGIVSLAYETRGRVPLTTKDWAIRSYDETPLGGWSSIGNPGAFAALSADGESVGKPVADAGCASLGGVDAGATCRFQYTRFVNLVEDETRWQTFARARRNIGPIEMGVEAFWAQTDVPHWQTSPSTPPQLWREQIVPVDHPGLLRFRADHPAVADRIYADGADPATTPLVFLGRALGYGGNPLTESGAAEGYRTRRTWRLGADMTAETGGSGRLDMGVFVSEAWGKRASADTYRAGFINALQGFGLCSDRSSTVIPDGLVAGEGGCVYFNPFSSALARSATTGAVNPDHVPELANSVALIDWLRDSVGLEATNGLVTADVLYSGKIGPDHAWALGGHIRRESYDVRPFSQNDVTRNPGPDGTGLFSFLAASTPVSINRLVSAVFSELHLRPRHDLGVQVAVRYENYGPVAALDPKLALTWKRGPFRLRASAQTSVRGPSPNQISGVTTSLQYVAPTGAFKAIDQYGTPGLQPEKARNYTLEMSWQSTHTQLMASLWRIDMDAAIIVQSQSDIVALAVQALESGATDAPILARIAFQNPLMPAASEIARVRTDIVNGPALHASGLTLSGRSGWDAGRGRLQVSGDIAYMLAFVTGPYAIDGNRLDGFDVAGHLNRTNPFRPLPRLKAAASIGYELGAGLVRLDGRYTSSYQDERSGDDIAHFAVFDLLCRYRFGTRLAIGLSVGNIFDSPPPRVAFDLNYDPYTHTPHGRSIKISLSHRFGADGKE